MARQTLSDLTPLNEIPLQPAQDVRSRLAKKAIF
jgi:hypothetical protein